MLLPRPWSFAWLLAGSMAVLAEAEEAVTPDVKSIPARGIRNQAIPTKARLTYFQDKNLVLELQYKSEDTWTPCFEIPEIKLPSVAYLGFSAATGELSDNFDIIKVETKNLYSAVGGTAGQAARKEFSKSKGKSYDPSKLHTGSGWSWFMLKFVFFGLALTGAYVGFTMWRANRRRDRF
ncbi:hypothetical protein LTR39_001173 [Cryomyces antarcticus]|nr:hypothetical protein LTR39_001173 [Cryomyces antarcticus]